MFRSLNKNFKTKAIITISIVLIVIFSNYLILAGDSPEIMCYAQHGAYTTIGGGTFQRLYNSTFVGEDNASAYKGEYKIIVCDTSWNPLPERNGDNDGSFFYTAHNYSVNTEITGIGGNIIVELFCKDKNNNGDINATIVEYDPSTQTDVFIFGSVIVPCDSSETFRTANISISAHTISTGNKIGMRVYARADSCPLTVEYKIKGDEYRAGGGVDTDISAAYCNNFGVDGDYKNHNLFVVNEEPTGADTCSCPSLNQNWEIDMADSCNIEDDCNLGTGNLSFTGSGYVNCNATIQISNMGELGSSGIFYVNSNCGVIQS